MAHRLAALLVAVVACVVYLPSLHAGLVSDDLFFTTRPWGINPLRHLASPWEHQLGLAVAYRPMTVFTYGLNQALWGTPLGFHAVNLLTHALASAGCVLLAGRLGLRPAFAVVCGLSFALHPVHHESVTWISGRTASLSSAWAVAAMVVAAGAHQSPRRWVAIAALAAGAILSYEGAFLLPVMLGAIALAVPHRNEVGTRRAVVMLAPVAVVWLAYIIVRWTVISAPGLDTWALSSAVSDEGLAPAVTERAVGNISAFVTRLLGAGWGLEPGQSRTFLVTAALTATGTVAAIATPTARRQVLLGLALSVLAFLPFVTYTGFADRFAYLPSVGLCLVLASGAQAMHAAGRRWSTPVLIAACVTVATLWTRQLLLAQADWVEAGRLASEIPARAVDALPTLPAGARLHVRGVPLNVRGAYVYITYFDRAMQAALGRDDVEVTMSPDPQAPCPPASSSRGVVCLRWEPATRTMARE